MKPSTFTRKIVRKITTIARGATLVIFPAALPLVITGCSGCVTDNDAESSSVARSSSESFTNEEIKAIVDRERVSRTDLPKRFDKFTWKVRREGAYFVYVEWEDPPGPGRNRIYKINRDGIIVDVQDGNALGDNMDCPERVFSEAELAEIVAKERARRSDLPPPFAEHRTRVSRLRCLYLYFEYRQPEKPGDYQVFTIDPLGEVMDFFRSEPY